MNEAYTMEGLERLLSLYSKGEDNIISITDYIAKLASSGQEWVLVTRTNSDGIKDKHKFNIAMDEDDNRYVMVFSSKNKVMNNKDFYLKTLRIDMIFDFIMSRNDVEGIVLNLKTDDIIFGKKWIWIVQQIIQKNDLDTQQDVDGKGEKISK